MNANKYLATLLVISAGGAGSAERHSDLKEVKDVRDRTVAYLSTNTRTRTEEDLSGKKIVVSPAESGGLRNWNIKEPVKPVDIQVGATRVGDPVYMKFYTTETDSGEPSPNEIVGGNWREIVKSVSGLKSTDVVIESCAGKYVCVRPPDGKPKCEQWRCVKP